jgi:hypothetical protein
MWLNYYLFYSKTARSRTGVGGSGVVASGMSIPLPILPQFSRYPRVYRLSISCLLPVSSGSFEYYLIEDRIRRHSLPICYSLVDGLPSSAGINGPCVCLDEKNDRAGQRMIYCSLWG